jgi:uncharacterized protein YjiS (DUF1127 family)
MTRVSALIPALPRPVDTPRQHYGLSALQDIVATYRARRRFRCDLERMAKENPHLIADIGLTKWQVEAEVAKRFWQA